VDAWCSADADTRRRRITHDYTDTFARAFSSLGTSSNPFRFVFVSGEGADQNEKGRALFSRIKGRTEKELKAMETDSFRTISVRPGGILPMPEVGVESRDAAMLGPGSAAWLTAA
jgi:hypothetical protein